MSQNRRKPIAIAAVLIAVLIAATAYFALCKGKSAGASPIASETIAVANESKYPIVAAGGYHSLAIDANGAVYATGDNLNGKLGLGDNAGRNAFALVASPTSKKIAAVAAGAEHSLALTSEGRVYATGANNNGQIGLGDELQRETFALVAPFADTKIAAVAAGFDHSFAIDENGKLYAAGWNYSGELGLGDNAARNAFAPVKSLEGKKITRVAAAGGVYALALSLALTSDGDVYATGYNANGQLGLGDNANRNVFTLAKSLEGKKIVAVAAGKEHSLALDASGKVYAAGSNDNGRLGLEGDGNRNAFAPVSSLSGAKIVAIAAGEAHSLALTSDGKVYAAGWNNEGQLGLGDENDRGVFTLVSSLEGKKIARIAAGGWNSFAVDESGKIYATGMNESGQLGLGDDKYRNVFALVTLSERQSK
ncbi:MAG: hypothetical protein LBO72_10775 [Helicobacteraceae bacterium]|jgi:alpha-tubulin suppressor-like RCC1 family protein|nr:hypothetical protein [Helicobacteraceae bacterium]